MGSELLADVIRPGTSRDLDFIILDELRKRTGITKHNVLKWAVSEMLCNSLDTDATTLDINVKTVGKFDEITVRDNGTKKISIDELKLILDFSNKASSKRGFLRVSRGYLGNALKCIFGYSYALSKEKELEQPASRVISHGTEYKITLKPDIVNEVINSDIEVEDTELDSFTAFTVSIPINRTWTRKQLREITNEPILETRILYDVIFSSSMVNPTRMIKYDLWGVKGSLGRPEEGTNLRQDTSILWYEPKQLKNLFYDFVRVRPEAKLKDFMALFRGFTSKKLQREILQQLTDSANHDSGNENHVQFFPATQLQELQDGDVEHLYLILRGKAKAISKRSIPKVLGVVGEKRFEEIKEQHGWKNLKYVCMKDRKAIDWVGNERGYADFPFLVELAIFDRAEHNDNDGLKIYQCVNFMASMEDIFSQLFNIRYRLGRVGITQEMPVTVLAHLVSPVLKWLNYGKSGLYE